MDFGIDPGDIDRIILHWTAGGPTPTSLDLTHYHALIDYTGRVHRGQYSVDDNVDTGDRIYAAHTLHANTRAAAIALCGMRGASEATQDWGASPITEAQFEKAAELAAEWLWLAGLPCAPHTALSHAEVEQTLGIKQRGKWDIAVLPWRGDIRGARAVGDYWRSLIQAHLDRMAPVERYRTDSATTLRAGNRTPSSQVRLLQGMLADQGYFSGKADGLFGPMTKAAVMAFQDGAGLDPDGVVGPKTWEALYAAPPREARHVTLAELREDGSRTIAAADATQVGAVATAGLGSILTVAEQLSGAEGTLASAQNVVLAYWPLILFGMVAAGGWYVARRLRAVRLDDAIRGRNLGR